VRRLLLPLPLLLPLDQQARQAALEQNSHAHRQQQQQQGLCSQQLLLDVLLAQQ
jgi:hypothetical protein